MEYAYRKVTAVVRKEALEKIANNLKEVGVSGLTVTNVEGFGEYANLYTHGWMVPCVKLELFVEQERAREIIGVIMTIAHTGISGDGIVAVQPVEVLYRIRTQAEVGKDAGEGVKRET